MTKKAIQIVLPILLLFTAIETASAQERELPKQSFWQNVDIEYNFALSSFSGDFDRYDGLIGLSPIPFNGLKSGISFVKPYRDFYGMTPRVRLGLSLMNYSSKTIIDNSYRFNRARGGVGPININNVIFGPEIGASIDIGIYQSLKISPGFGFGFYANMPRTDGFVDEDGRISRQGSTNRLTRDFSLSSGSRGTAVGEKIPNGIGAAMLEGRLSFTMAGTEYFLSYTYKRFLNNYFDGVYEISRDRGANFAMLTGFGIRVPIKRGIRNEQIGNDYSTQLRLLRRNMDTRNPAHLEEFFKTFDDLVYDRNAIGLTQNRLAAKVELVEVPLGNTSMTIEFARIPGSTYVIGHADEDPFQIQNYGRIRVSVQDFLMSRTTITNKHYRLFLLAMGHSFEGSDRLQSFITGAAPSFNEVIENARLAGVNLPEGIALNTVNDLLPDENSWNSQNLGNILSFREYLYSEEFDDYPVVGVNWYQARMFAAWAGFRLPNEVEWEYAAKAGVGGRTLPWDGYSAQDSNGNYLANFMQSRGVYNLDGYTLMAPARSFRANEFGLFNMAGNVSEWVADSYSSTYQVLRRDQIMVTPANIDFSENRKVHRGGSWASSLFFIGSGVRNFQLGHTASPTIGFRVATSRFLDRRGISLEIPLEREEIMDIPPAAQPIPIPAPQQPTQMDDDDPNN